MRENLLQQKEDCENAILALMKDQSSDHFFVRGVLENLIAKIEQRLEQS
jgi:nitrogen regulatory protein PII-like uncharacterized protein